MPDHNHYLALDLGTSALKALVVARDGTPRGHGAAPYHIARPRPGHAEQDPADWWRAAVAAARQALSEADHPPVAALGLSGQMHGTVLLGADDQPLHPAVIWPDTRSQAEVEELTAALGPARLIELTGSPVATGFQAATVRWFVRERPDLWARVRRVLLPKDWLRLRLTGEAATDPSDASGALLLDVRRRDWAPEVLAAVGLDRALLPPVLPSTAIAGRLRPEAAAELDLPAGTPVVAGAADAATAALGAGIADGRTLLLTLSTGTQVLVPAPAVRTDPLGRLHTFCAALEPGKDTAGWYAMGATLAAGLALSWLRDRVFALAGHDAPDRLTALAAEAPPGARGLLFLPHLAGERTPHMDPRARGLYLGLTPRHGRPELARAALEGITFAALDAFHALRDLGAAPDRIVLAGGGARSPLWRQLVADAFALPVLPLAVAEQSAAGAALLAAAALGHLDPATAAPTWATYGTLLDPTPAHTARYAALFARYRTLYPKLRDDFAALAAFDDDA